MSGLTETDIEEFPLAQRGKVRDIYEIDSETLLIVATDRISAFDSVLPTPIPERGKILNLLSDFWFTRLAHIVPNHRITIDIDEFPEPLGKYRKELIHRSMLVRKAKPLPVECIVRGYLAGGGYREYRRDGSICGIQISAGLKISSRLPEPIFTPSTKSETGHDINITFEETERLLGRETARFVREKSLELYREASEYADRKGIIIADTKFEFGKRGKKIILIDEALTPDSSRFWMKDKYTEGKEQESFDKEFVRGYLRSINWTGEGAPPPLPEDIVARTQKLYFSLYSRFVGRNYVDKAGIPFKFKG